MSEPLLQSGWESLLYGAPVLGLLLMSIFKLDTIASAPRTSPRRRPAMGTCADGEPLGCDPDGRLWSTRRRKECAVAGRGSLRAPPCRRGSGDESQ